MNIRLNNAARWDVRRTLSEITNMRNCIQAAEDSRPRYDTAMYRREKARLEAVLQKFLLPGQNIKELEDEVFHAANTPGVEHGTADTRLTKEIMHDVQGMFEHIVDLEHLIVTLESARPKIDASLYREEITMLQLQIQLHLAPGQNMAELKDEVFHVADAPPDVGIETRYLTVDDLPKAPRHILPPKKIRPATHAKKLHLFLRRMKSPGDCVTHIKTGKTWDYRDGDLVTPETFLEYI